MANKRKTVAPVAQIEVGQLIDDKLVNNLNKCSTSELDRPNR